MFVFTVEWPSSVLLHSKGTTQCERNNSVGLARKISIVLLVELEPSPEIIIHFTTENSHLVSSAH